MVNETLRIFGLLARNGVVHRDEVKNNISVIERFVYHGLVRKVCRSKKVFYELTVKALPILESRRKALLEDIRTLADLHKPPSIYHVILDDVRFLDEQHEAAEQFKFLGDWQFQRPVVPSQIELAKLRYYQKELK